MRFLPLLLCLLSAAALAQDNLYPKLCGGCHGASATGTEKGPALTNNRGLRSMSVAQIQTIIRSGTQGGMPPFALPETQLNSLARWVHGLNASAFNAKPEGDVKAGEQFYFGKGQCGTCHMVAGRGGSNGPDLSNIGRDLTLHQLETSLDDPSVRAMNRSASGCPGWAWCPNDSWTVFNVRTKSGATLRGFARNQGKHDIQLQTLNDGKFHLLREGEYISAVREDKPLMPKLAASATERRDLVAYLSTLGGIAVGATAGAPPVPEMDQQRILNPAKGDWPTYNGHVRANRHSELSQITVSNAAKLRLQWSASLPYQGLEMTPLVVDGTMYVTGPNQVCALDGQTGRRIWCYQRPRTPAGVIAGDAAKGANRGVAILGDRVFFVTDNAHILCINRITGGLMWEVNMPDRPGHYGSTVAPLVVNDLVIAGVAGADEGIRGFVAAYKASTGELAWRVHTVPLRGEPGSETWQGKAPLEDGGGSTWVTGSYDADLGLLYWPTGNPFPATDGSERKGDNLYTNCVLAIDVKTGKLKWHYQFTPHDLHDWDATEPLVLVDAPFAGKTRKLLIQGNRNGFYYVLDRVTGEFLTAKPFVKRLTWASGIGKDGRPQLTASNAPTVAGVKGCPAVRGATNWYSTSYNPSTKLFYLMAVEDCSIYKLSQLGGYLPSRDPSSPPEKVLRALDIETGKIAWEIPQVGPPESNYAGILTTDGGLLFYGETGGGFAALDAKSGKALWHFETNQEWKASPMTYLVNGRQHVAIASGGNILAFAVD